MEFRRCKEMLLEAGFDPDWIGSLNEETTIHAFYNDFFYLQVYSDRRETVVQGIDLHKYDVPGDRRSKVSAVCTTYKNFDGDILFKGLHQNIAGVVRIICNNADHPERINLKLQEFVADMVLRPLEG